MTGADPQAIVVNGIGDVLDHGDEPDRRPDNARWISYADMRANAPRLDAAIRRGDTGCAPAPPLRGLSGQRVTESVIA